MEPVQVDFGWGRKYFEMYGYCWNNFLRTLLKEKTLSINDQDSKWLQFQLFFKIYFVGYWFSNNSYIFFFKKKQSIFVIIIMKVWE